MAAPLLTLQDIYLTFGGDPLLVDAGLQVQERDRIALVGRNGSGKSTLLKVAAGLIEPDRGTRVLRQGVVARYLEQDPVFDPTQSLDDIARGHLSPTEEDTADILTYFADLELDPSRTAAGLSGGEARKLALIRGLAGKPDILLLDEPTNHLDLETILWLEKVLGRYGGALVLISHDRRFLSNVTTKTVWIDRGSVKTLSDGFSAFEAWRDKVYEEEERDRHKLDRKIVREEHWLRYGVTARRKRNVRRLDGLHALRHRRAELLRPTGKAAMSAAESEASGKKVIHARDISFAFGQNDVVKNFTLQINRGDRIGIVGPNGAGKTTLLKLLMGDLQPNDGSVEHGTKLEPVTLDQQRATLPQDWTLVQAVSGDKSDQVTVDGQQRHAMGYLKEFLFKPEQARQPVSALSGGEKGRLALAIALARPSNLLVLDEPTNDLDLETLDVLEDMLVDYQGTVLLISHDRDFLNRTVTSTIVRGKRAGEWIEYAGGYDDMISLRKLEERKPPPSPTPSAKTEHKQNTEPRQQTKLSYKEKYALETLPGEMEKLQDTIATCQATLSDPNLFTRDPDQFEKVSQALTTAEQALVEAEEQWLELEMKRESLER